MEETGDWRKLHNEELHTFYSTSDISRVIISWRMRWAEHVERKGYTRNAYILVRKHKGKRVLG